MDELYDRMAARYAAGDVPWDDALPPPEVQAIISDLEPGQALDLGCGYGRAAIYMAARGWRVDAIDFIPEAIQVASTRAERAGVEVRFHLAEVTNLDFLTGPYDFALDVGCAHGLDDPKLRKYRDQLHRLLRKGAIFLLFARLRENGSSQTKTTMDDLEESDSPSGLKEQIIKRVFSQGFELEQFERGLTEMADQTSWSSAWFQFRRSYSRV